MRSREWPRIARCVQGRQEMISSSEDAIRFAQDDRRSESSTNWYVLLFAVIVTLFSVYWGFVRPTSRQLTKLRRYVTSLESSISELNVQRLNNGQTVSMLEQMVQQEEAVKNATAAVREMRELHRQIVHESEQLATARQALDSLIALRTQVARQSTLIDSTNQALTSLGDLRRQLSDSAAETAEAQAAVEQLSLLRDGLIESISSLEDVQPVITEVEQVQQRIAAVADGTEATEVAVTKVESLHNRIRSTVVSRTEEVATAIETLELSSDVKLEMKRASETFQGVKRMLAEFSLMGPALQQALDSLQPLSELADLRRLGVHELRRVAMNLNSRDAAFAHSIVETVPEATPVAVEPEKDPIEEYLDATEVELAEIPELTDLSNILEDAGLGTASISDSTSFDLVATEVEPAARPVELEVEKTSYPLPTWSENEVVKAVVKAVSEAAQEVSEAVEVIADAKDTTVK